MKVLDLKVKRIVVASEEDGPSHVATLLGVDDPGRSAVDLVAQSDGLSSECQERRYV